MTNVKSTKRSLLSSVVALILCFAMLLGTTYAWFTDEVKSKNHIIKSGNLDIELYHSDDTVTGEQVTEQTTLFDDIALWEPGAVVYETFDIKNEGDLALKYQLSVNVNEVIKDNVNLSQNAEKRTLADVLMVGVIENGATSTDRKALVNEVGSWSSLATFTLPGELQPRQEADTDAEGKEVYPTDTYTVVIYWMPTANDNAYKALQLDIGVTLLATQLSTEAEKDSFDEKYDKDAWVDGMKIFSATDLQAAINAGETDLKLMADITTDEPIVIPASATTFAMRAVPTVVTIDLNGKTITGTVGVDSEGNRVHTLVNYGNLVLKNGTIKSAGVNGGSAICNEAGATLTIDETVTVLGAPKAAGSWPSYGINNYGYMTVDGTTIKTYHGGIATNDGAETVINDANIDVGQGTATAITSYTLYTQGTGKLTVNGGIFANTATDANGTGGAIANAAGENAIVITGGDFSGGCGLYGNYVISGGVFDRDVEKFITDDVKVFELNGKYYVLGDDEYITLESLQAAIDAATEAGEYTFILGADIAGDLKITQKNDVKIIIDGNDKTFNGVMTVFGNGRKATAALTIKNIDFVDATGASSCIVSPDRKVNNAYSYSSNVTVENCTFTDPDGVVNCAAVRHEDG